MRHATALLYHVCAVASRNIRFASCGTSGKLTLWTRYVHYNTNLLRGRAVPYVLHLIIEDKICRKHFSKYIMSTVIER
jgi:hypothetical protein